MKKTIILLLGIVLYLNGVDLKSSEPINQQGKYLYKISKKFSLEENGRENYMFTDTEVFNTQNQLLQYKRDGKDFGWMEYYTYNTTGQKIKEVSITPLNPQFNTTTLYDYDEKGDLIEVKKLNNNDELQSVKKVAKSEDNRTKREYNNKLIKELKTTVNTSTQMKNSKPLERTIYYGEKVTTYAYDNAGHEIKKEFIDRDVRMDKQVYKYDKEGNLLSENNSSTIKSTIKEHYVLYKEYDVHNNLTKEYTKVFKRRAACIGGIGYVTPNYTLVFHYDKENRVLQIDESTKNFRTTLYYKSRITYEYDDELRF